jgi:hypothetical protein
MFGTVLSALAAAVLLRYAFVYLDPATVMLAGGILALAVIWRMRF